ncbi:MAG: hypothetical protein LC808_04345, partial [Actinobacteria bacterium]|nr:hypothetical protein [Actinomycetota bacterium]
TSEPTHKHQKILTTLAVGPPPAFPALAAATALEITAFHGSSTIPTVELGLVGRPETFDRKPGAGGEWGRWRCVPRRCLSVI